jgi:hypothetical protein
MLVASLAMMAAQACNLHDRYSSNASGEYRWSYGPRTVTVKALGEIRFAEDDQSIAGLSADGYLLIEEKVLLDSKAVEFTRRADGSVGTRLLAAGKEKPLDADDRAWIARMLSEVVRRTGLNAEERAARPSASR